ARGRPLPPRLRAAPLPRGRGGGRLGSTPRAARARAAARPAPLAGALVRRPGGTRRRRPPCRRPAASAAPAGGPPGAPAGRGAPAGPQWTAPPAPQPEWLPRAPLMAGAHRERSTPADYTRPVTRRISPWLHAGEAAILVGVIVVLLLTGLLVVVDAFRDLFL